MRPAHEFKLLINSSSVCVWARGGRRSTFKKKMRPGFSVKTTGIRHDESLLKRIAHRKNEETVFCFFFFWFVFLFFPSPSSVISWVSSGGLVM